MSGRRLDLGGFVGLEGDRIILRRFTPGDITPDYIGWLNDRVVTRYSSQRFCTHTRASCEAYLARFADMLADAPADRARVRAGTAEVGFLDYD